MPIDIETLGIDRLSVLDRLQLIEDIWNTLPTTLDPAAIPSWHIEEIARRRGQTTSEVGKPWREVLDALRDDK